MSQGVFDQGGLGGHPEPRPSARTVLSLHGRDEVTGRPVTWHVTPLADDGAPGTYLVERVDGDIHNPAVWMQAQRVADTVGEEGVIALVRRVVLAPPA